MIWSEVLRQHLPGRTEESHEKSPLVQPVSKPRSELRAGIPGFKRTVWILVACNKKAENRVIWTFTCYIREQIQGYFDYSSNDVQICAVKAAGRRFLSIRPKCTTEGSRVSDWHTIQWETSWLLLCVLKWKLYFLTHFSIMCTWILVFDMWHVVRQRVNYLPPKRR